MNILLTGGHGFIGSRLGPALRARGHAIADEEFDLFDEALIARSVRAEPWDTVVHLAAISTLAGCDADPDLAWRTNRDATRTLADAVWMVHPEAHFIHVSTGYVYQPPVGDEITQGVVFDETRAIAPANLYARTKWASEQVLTERVTGGRSRATILRLFNHTHHSQPPTAFLPHVHQQLLAHTGDGPAHIPVGNLDVERDFGGLGDLLDAFVAVIEAPAPTDQLTIYNVCNGTARNVGDLARHLAGAMGVEAIFETDPDRVRPNEARLVVGSHDRLTRATAWTPACHTLDDLVSAFLSDDGRPGERP